jgi:hypothetical protein
MAGRKSESGRLAVIWLATTVVIVLGASGTALVVVALAQDRNAALTVWGACFAVVVLVLVILNVRWDEPVNHLKFWLSYRERGNPADEYVAARRRISSREKFGTNEPPSVEVVRDAANHGGAWVPRSTVSRSRHKKQ